MRFFLNVVVVVLVGQRQFRHCHLLRHQNTLAFAPPKHFSVCTVPRLYAARLAAVWTTGNSPGITLPRRAEVLSKRKQRRKIHRVHTRYHKLRRNDARRKNHKNHTTFFDTNFPRRTTPTSKAAPIPAPPMSIRLFREYLVVNADGTIDARGIISKACFYEWLKTRRIEETAEACKKYQRTLSNHLSGVDGRCPFNKNEEDAILRVVRRKERWPCFGPEITIGHTGFRSKGYHEKQQQQFNEASTADIDNEEIVEVKAAPKQSKHAAKRARAKNAKQTNNNELAAAAVVKDNQEENTWMVLGKSLYNYYTSLAKAGVDAWESVQGIFKFVVLHQLLFSKPVDKEHINKLLQNESSTGFTVVFDLINNYQVVAQNLASHKTFGNLLGSTHKRLIRADSLPQAIVAAGNAFFNQGTKFTAMVALEFGGECCLTTFYVDPHSRLLVMYKT